MQVRSLENRAFLLLLALVTIAFAWTIKGFLLPVFWAIVLSVLFTPMYRRIRRWMRGYGTPASLVTLLVVFLAVVVPLIGLGAAVTGEAVDVYQQVRTGQIDLTEPIQTVEDLLPRVNRRADELGIDFDGLRENITSGAVTASQTVASSLLSFGQQALEFTLLLAVTFYVLFFFIRDGDALVAALIRALPLGDPRERRLFSRFANVTRATIKGTFVVAAVQGTLGGIAFAALGLGAPILWGMMMGICSLIPAVGSAIVWGPAAIYLLLVGSWGKALILVIFGAGVIGVVDNALRPILVGRDAGMPDYLILLSTLGGLAAFGVSGLVIGPVVAGFFLTVWEIFAEEFGPVDDTIQVPAHKLDGKADDIQHVEGDVAADGTTEQPAPAPSTS
ncbi:MAG: AI-2E family transporter [Bacteroidota bacterium]